MGISRDFFGPKGSNISGNFGAFFVAKFVTHFKKIVRNSLCRRATLRAILQPKIITAIAPKFLFYVAEMQFPRK